MIWMCAIICGCFSCVGFLQDRKIYSASGVFAGFWALLLVLAGVRFYGLYATSVKACMFILFGVVSFCMGSAVMRRIKTTDIASSDLINDRAYNILVLICLIGLIYNIRVIISYFIGELNIYNIYNLMARTVNGETTELSSMYSSWQVRLQQYVGYPLLYTIVPISIIGYIKEHRKKYLFVAILLSALRFIYDMRRTYLVIMIIYVAVVLMMCMGDFTVPKWWNQKLKKRLILSGIIAGIGFVMISSSRAGEDEKYSFFYNIYMYYAGSLPYFSERLANLGNFNYTWGMTSLRGLFAPLFAVLGVFGFPEPKLMTMATDNIQSLHDTVLFITSGHRFNSYATVFFEFYLDSGVIGIVLFSFLFGVISRYLYRKATLYGSMRDEFRYAYFFSLFLMLSTLHFNGAVVCYIWPFIIERVLFNKRVEQ